MSDTLSAVIEVPEATSDASSNESEYTIEIEEEEEVKISHKAIWNEICEEHDERKKAVEENKLRQMECFDAPENPELVYLNENVYPLLKDILEKVLFKAKALDSLQYEKSTFNGVDYISEMLWNLNPRHPERQRHWTKIYDMDWVQYYLSQHPRPYFPFSYVWSKDFAAVKIQAAIRGYWVRSREDVQELRQFWKLIKEEQTAADGDENANDGQP